MPLLDQSRDNAGPTGAAAAAGSSPVGGPGAATASADGRPEAMGGHAARGALWLTLQTALGKAVGIGGQVVVAYYLAREDFGLISQAFTACAFPALLCQIGLREVLLRRQAHFERWAWPAVWMATASGIASTLFMLAAGPIAAAFFFAPGDAAGATAAGGGAAAAAAADNGRRLVQLVAVLALSAPFTCVSTVPLARLQSRLRFRAISLVTFVHVVATTAMTVWLAHAGYGPFSFAIPWPVLGALRLAVLWWMAPPPAGADWRPRVRRWRYLIGDSGRVMLARAFVTLIAVGDYMMLARYHPDHVVGVYYFAFSLSMQTIMLLATNLDGVLMPVLTKLQDEPIRQRDAFLATARVMALLGVPACLLQAAVADPVVRLIFQPKWYGAVPILQVLSLGMAFRLLALPAQSLVQSQGRFRAFVWLNACGALVFITLVTAAAARSTTAAAALHVAVAVAVYFALEGPALVYAAIAPAGGRWRQVAGAYAVPIAAGAVATGAGMLAADRLPDSPAPGWLVARAAVVCLVMAAVYLPLTRWLMRDTWADLLLRARALRRRGGSAGA